MSKNVKNIWYWFLYEYFSTTSDVAHIAKIELGTVSLFGDVLLPSFKKNFTLLLMVVIELILHECFPN